MSRWATKPLGAICTFANGLWTGKKGPLTTAGVFRNTNFRPHGFLDDGDVAYLQVEQKQLDKRRLKSGDIIIEKSGGGPKQAVGRVAFFNKAEGVYSFSNFTSVARVNDNAEVDPRYVLRFLDWCYISGVTERMQSNSTGIRNLDFSAYKAIEVPLPPLGEQQRIVAVLDEAFTAIATATGKAEKNLANARGLFERCLAEIFESGGSDWIVEPLKTNVRFIDYRGRTPPKRGTGIRLITAKNVKMGFIQRQPEEFIDPAAYDSWMTRGFPRQGDVLFTTEAPLGNVAQLDTEEQVVIGQRLITMQPDKDSIDPTFLKYMLCSAPLQRLILRQATGATVSGIKAKLLKEIPICYPCRMSEQLDIVERLDALYALTDTLADLTRTKIRALVTLKQSVLREAFSGQLGEQVSLAA